MAIEKEIVVPLPDGEAEAVLIQPSAEGKWPGVLYLTDIGGIRPAQREAVRRLSHEGYVILMPNVFYRTSKLPVMDVASLRQNMDLFMQRVGELAQPLTPDAQERDAKGYVDYISTLAPGNIGVVGFCFCGAFAMRTAAACPDRVAAAASFHGGNLYEDKPTSPHLILPRIKARLLFGHAENDRSMPSAAITAFENALKDSAGHYESETYQGALHGWTTLDNPAYNSAQAARAYQKLTALFSDTLTQAE